MEQKMSDGLSGHRHGAALPAGSALVALLLGLAGGAWLISARLATPDMRVGVLTAAAMMSAGSQMGMPGSTSMGLSAFIATWTVMMVAMMVPSLVPAVRTFDTWARTTGLSGGATVLFVTGYLLVWSTIGAVAYLIVQALQGWLPAGSMAALRVGAALLVVAGVYQLTPPKRACLRRCRSPQMGVAPLVGTRVQGHPGAVRAGLGQGLYCLGSSWPLMLVLLLVGLMNLIWMGVIAGVIVLEKAAPGGIMASKVVGWGLVGGGLILLAAPHTLPALGGDFLAGAMGLSPTAVRVSPCRPLDHQGNRLYDVRADRRHPTNSQPCKG
jgi:predicted metal-binding membrane protein